MLIKSKYHCQPAIINDVAKMRKNDNSNSIAISRLSGNGTYILVLFLNKKQCVTIGKLGQFDFPPGYYAYIGSAFGPGGLASRIGHHIAISSNPHWHIDYLRFHVELVQVWYCSQMYKREHDWADTMAEWHLSQKPVKGFGCSDCRCESHLFYFKLMPNISDFQLLLDKSFSQDPPLKVLNMTD